VSLYKWGHEDIALNIEKENSRVFDGGLDFAKEKHSLPAVDQTVIIGKANVHHWANFNLNKKQIVKK